MKPGRKPKKMFEVLDFIKQYIRERGRPPTHQDIRKHFQFKSANSSWIHVKNLEKVGKIELTPGIARGIRILKGEENGQETAKV